jgi:hypothetical protein
LTGEIGRYEVALQGKKHIKRFLGFVFGGSVLEGHFPLFAFFFAVNGLDLV